ncbi:hypothetical protein CJ030_MR5G005109 [Morella rubra]|uniref:DUF4216 domain-containing protein n=1 Tax=Morella rubra TaxID=262757 RepID=A0A6A1VJS2_9ROSI|nr:hypothetical protein CJ030_MR5G005109 [Morella rubra]
MDRSGKSTTKVGAQTERPTWPNAVVVELRESIWTMVEPTHVFCMGLHKSWTTLENNFALAERGLREEIQIMPNENLGTVSYDLYALASSPDQLALCYSGYVVNGVRFYTVLHEHFHNTQNSGVVVSGDHAGEDVDFYDQVVKIYPLHDLRKNLVYLLKCDWFDLSTQNLSLDKSCRFVNINISRKWYKDDPYVLTSQGNQVFYVDDMKLGSHWKIVQKIIFRNTYDILTIEEEASKDEEGLSNHTKRMSLLSFL